MYRISKAFTFAAAHHLPSLPEGHKCRRPHGHNYEVELYLAAEVLDEYGFVLDYAQLDRFRDWLRETVDHRDLNGLTEFRDGTPTSAENLAQWLYEMAATILGIGPHTNVVLEGCLVKETPTTTAEYLP